jgi:hypothetical protein
MLKIYRLKTWAFIVIATSFTSLNLLFSQNLNDVYDVLPVVANCKPGVLKQSEIDKALSTINRIRSLHKLKPVTYETLTQAASMEGCLNIVASGVSGHVDDPSSECYTSGGGQARKKSNLFAGKSSSPIFYTSEEILIGWLIDDSNADVENQYKVGHRRAIINPFLTRFSYGRAEGYTKSGSEYIVASNFHYQDYTDGSANDLTMDYIAVPFENYPITYINKAFYLSFNAVIDKNNLGNNKNVDYSSTTVTMTTEDGETVNVSSVQYDNEGWGNYFNNLSWKADGLQNEVKYLVNIKNVKFNSSSKDYSYWFRLTNNDYSKPPVTPILKIPADIATNVKPTNILNWDLTINAAYFKLQVAKDAQFSQLVINKDYLPLNSYSPTELVNDTKYFWRVKAGNDAGESEWTNTWSFTTASPKPATPSLVLPLTNTTVNTLIPKLVWNAVAGTDTYSVQVSLNDQFSGINIKYINASVKDTFVEIPKSKLDSKKLYYWRVLAKNASGSSNYSEIWSFNTGTALSIPTTLYPFDKSTNIPAVVTIKWQVLDKATSYQLQLNDKADFNISFIVYENNITATEYTVPKGTLKPNTEYFWRLRGESDQGFSDWTNIMSFTTDPTAGVSDLNLNESVTIYPNPNNGIFNIELPSSISLYNIRIFDLTGRIVFQTQSNQSTSINVGNLESTIYILKISNGQNVIHKIMNIIK